VVLAPGQTAVPPAMLQKVDRYRVRWEQWFSTATDGRGRMVTSLNGTCPEAPPPDAGTPSVDGGAPDAGAATEPDAGAATPPEQFGDPPPSKWDTYVGNSKIRPGCGCSAGGAPLLLAAALLLRASNRRDRTRALGR